MGEGERIGQSRYSYEYKYVTSVTRLAKKSLCCLRLKGVLGHSPVVELKICDFWTLASA